MPKRNNPYSRPISATKESAQTIGEYYGTPAKAVAVNHAAGGRNVAPASRYQAVGNAYVAPTADKPKVPKAKIITAEDLFE